MTMIRIFIFCIVISYGCSAQKNLSSTSWENQLMRDCILKFENSKSVTYYDCEDGSEIAGEYTVSGDTVIISYLKSNFDSEFPENSRHRMKPFKIEYLLENETLEAIRFIQIKESGSNEIVDYEKGDLVFEKSN